MIDLVKEGQEFIKNLEIKGKSFNTLKNYKTDLNIFNQFLGSKGRNLVIDGLGHEEVKEYTQFLHEKYASPNSIRRRVQALRIFFDYLIEKGAYDENPIKRALVSAKVVDPPRPLPFDEVIKLKMGLESFIEGSSGLEQLINMRNKLLFYLIYGGGLKVSDIETLTESSLFLEKKPRVLVAHPKRDPFTVSLPESFGEFYDIYHQALNERKLIDNVEFDQLLFNANPYKILKGGLSSRGIEVIFKEFGRKLGHPVTAKSLRQSCIFKWMNQGKTESQIKEWMGVQPAYSLRPYKELLENRPDEYVYKELEEDQ